MRADLDGAGGYDDLPPGKYGVPDGCSGAVRGEFDSRSHEWKRRLRPEDFRDLWIGVRGETFIENEQGMMGTYEMLGKRQPIRPYALDRSQISLRSRRSVVAIMPVHSLRVKVITSDRVLATR